MSEDEKLDSLVDELVDAIYFKEQVDLLLGLFEGYKAGVKNPESVKLIDRCVDRLKAGVERKFGNGYWENVGQSGHVVHLA